MFLSVQTVAAGLGTKPVLVGFFFKVPHGVMRVKPTERAPDLYNRPATMKYNPESGRWEASYDEDGAPAGEILLLKYWWGQAYFGTVVVGCRRGA